MGTTVSRETPICRNTAQLLRELADHIEARNARHARLLFCTGQLAGSLTSTEPGHLTFSEALRQLFRAAGMVEDYVPPAATLKAMEAGPELLAACKALREVLADRIGARGALTYRETSIWNAAGDAITKAEG